MRGRRVLATKNPGRCRGARAAGVLLLGVLYVGCETRPAASSTTRASRAPGDEKPPAAVDPRANAAEPRSAAAAPSQGAEGDAAQRETPEAEAVAEAARRYDVEVSATREDDEPGPFPKQHVALRLGTSSEGLALARSPDGALWMRRAWDDGTAHVFQFSTSSELDGGSLQFVDGLWNEIPFPAGYPMVAFPAPTNRFGEKLFLQAAEAWVLSADGAAIVRPSTGESFPVRWGKTGVPGDVGATRWFVFDARCAPEGKPCVHGGQALDACKRYMSERSYAGGYTEHAPGLWFHPPRCLD